MTMRLSHKKKIGKLIADSKGFSAVIGTVFMVLVMMFLSTSVFLWTLSQNTLYNQELKEKNQVELDRLNERVTAFGVNYTGSSGTISVQVALENNGASAVQITTLWVMDATVKKYGFNDTLDLNLKPGNKTYLTGENAVDVNIADANATDTLNSWFVTTRGNTVPLEEEQSIIVAQLAQGIGSMALDFYAFRYFEYESATKLKNYPTGIRSFNVPGSGTPIAFGAVLTNLDPRKESVTFDLYSNIWLMFPGAPGQVPQWYIVNVASDGTIAASYSPISLAYGQTKVVIFASSKVVAGAGSFSDSSISSSITPNPCAVNLLLLGMIGTRDYGQNIPFVSLYIYKP